MNPKYSRYYTFVKPIFRNQAVKTYNSFAFSLIIITIFALFAIRPTLVTITALQKQITQQQQVLSQLNAKSRDLALAKNNLNSLPQSVNDQINNLLPSRTDPTGLASILTSWANQYSASISGLQYQTVDLVGDPPVGSTSSTLAELNFTFNITGGYQTLSAVLQALSNSARMLYIDDVKASKNSDQPLVMTINGKAYFLK